MRCRDNCRSGIIGIKTDSESESERQDKKEKKEIKNKKRYIAIIFKIDSKRKRGWQRERERE